MSEQRQFETEVVLKVRMKHWETVAPDFVVAHLKAKLLNPSAPAVISCEQVGEEVTYPEWPYNKKS